MLDDSINCDGTVIDLIVNDDTLELVQDVIDLLDSLGHWIGYEAHEEAGAPIYILDGEDIAA